MDKAKRGERHRNQCVQNLLSCRNYSAMQQMKKLPKAPSPEKALSDLLRKQTVTATLQYDLVEFSNSVKFLLLFFDKPFVLLSTPVFENLNDHVVNLYRKTGLLYSDVHRRTSEFINPQILLTDEWTELIAQCREIVLPWADGDPCDEQLADEALMREFFCTAPRSQLLKFSAATGPLKRKKEPQLRIVARNAQERALMQKLAATLGPTLMARAKRVLELSAENGASVMWGEELDAMMANLALGAMINEARKVAGKARDFPQLARNAISGQWQQDVLQAISATRAPSLSTVPVERILRFRTSARADLNHFWTHRLYDILQFESETGIRKQQAMTEFLVKLHKDLAALTAELSAIRDNRRYKWLAASNEGAYALAKVGKSMATLGWLAMPTIMSAIVNWKAKIGSSASEHRSKLALSSTGFLWRVDNELLNQR